jgi:hypothetical protein
MLNVEQLSGFAGFVRRRYFVILLCLQQDSGFVFRKKTILYLAKRYPVAGTALDALIT